MEKRAAENPERFLKEVGVDINNLDLEELKSIASNMAEQGKSLENIFKGNFFKDLNNFHNKVRSNPEATEADKKKLQELGIRAFNKDMEQKSEFCFIGNECENEIIDAHSIQNNGELSLIAKEGKVFHFIKNIQNEEKEKSEIHISKASIFKGFCKKHDNRIFEPIDKKKSASIEEEYFLYTLRSFAFSYHSIKSYKDCFLNYLNNTASGLNPLVDSLKGLADSIGMKLPDELNEVHFPEISNEQMQILEIERFEKHRKLLIEFINKKSYDQLEYLIYEKDYLCPIACSSWMVLHIPFGNQFLIVNDGNTPYYGFLIIISLIPFKGKTKIILARFKADTGSELIFNQWRNAISNKVNFEKELSKLIIENVENFYLSPTFYNKLSEEEKRIINNAVNIEKEKFPNQRTQFEVLNFFDQKYALNN